MKSIDAIIVSDAKNEGLRRLTQQTIDTATDSEKNVEVNIIVIEKQDCKFFNALTIKQEGEFCYNKYLNQGAALGSSEYIAFCNNDLIFIDNWATKIIEAMEEHNVSSACPYSPISNFENKTGIGENTGVHFGYEVRKEFVGWCIVWKRSLWDKMKLDEGVKFWASDNATAKILMNAGEKHILVTNSVVHHVENGSNTLNTIEPTKKDELMHRQIKIYNRLYNDNYFNLGTE
jgi:GT2 family glycosyltransferase